MDERSLSHTRWKCQYHVVIVPKYRRKVIYGKLRKDIGAILQKLCEYKYGRRCFWTKGYYISTVGANKAAIAKYIREQEMEDQMSNQLSFKEYEDPFQDLEE